MNRLLLAFVALFLALWLILGSWWYAKHYGGVASSPNFSITMDGFEISAPETFSFYESSPDPIIPEKMEEAFQTLADLLVTNENKKLKLFGIHSAQESQANLGKARAEAIKLELVNLGAPEAQIMTSDIPLASGQFINGQIYGGVHFRFEDMNKKPVLPVYEDTPVTGQLPPLNIYFDNNEFRIELNDKLDNYLESAKTIMRKHPSAKLYIIGHTDTTGDPDKNMSLSRTRAKSVKKFLIRQGFDPQRLKLKYKGAKEPISANNSEAGKRKNRRVELRLRD